MLFHLARWYNVIFFSKIGGANNDNEHPSPDENQGRTNAKTHLLILWLRELVLLGFFFRAWVSLEKANGFPTCFWANYSDRLPPREFPQMVVKSKGSVPKIPETFRFRNYTNLPRQCFLSNAF